MQNRRHHLLWIRNVKRRLAQHVKDKSNDNMTQAIHYTDPMATYFSAQRDQVVKCAPFLVLPSCLLPASHAIATVDPITTTPLFIHRSSDAADATATACINTVVRAYVNQCRHRGAQLIQQQQQQNSKPTTTLIRGSAVVCPYHSWTYDVTTGALKGVPGEKDGGFPCLDKSQHGLIKHVDCFESAGGIWLGQMKNDYWPLIDAEMSALLLPSLSSSSKSRWNNNDDDDDTTKSSIFVGYKEWHLNANWQLLVETFLEAYHVKYLHKDTLGRVSHSNIMVTDVLDDYSLRMTVPLKHFDAVTNPKSHDDNADAVDVFVDDDELESFLSQTTTTYFLFPNTAISLFKRFILYLSIVPSTCDSSAMTTRHDDDKETDNQPSCKSHVRAWAIARNNPNHNDSNGDVMALTRRDFESVIRGVEEDWECAEGIQSGLMATAARAVANNKNKNSNNNTTPTLFVHGCFEGNNVAFLHHVGLMAQELQEQRLQDKDK